MTRFNEYIGQFFFKFGYNISYKIIDRGIFEIFGPMGLSKSILNKSTLISNLQTGYLYHITLIMLIGSTFLLGFRQFWVIAGDLFDFRLFIIIFLSTCFLIVNKTK